MSSYSTIQQHEPLRVPAGWTGQEKQLIVQLEEILDDLYSRFNRLKMTDLAKSVRKIITDASEGVIENAQAILDSADTITHAYTALVENTQGSILQTVQDIYTAQTETDELRGQMSTQFEQTASSINAVVSDVASINNEFGQKVAASITWARLDNEGLHLGTGTGRFETVLSDTRLSFKQDGSEVAYVSNNKLYINSAEIISQLKIGDVTFQDIGNALILK